MPAPRNPRRYQTTHRPVSTPVWAPSSVTGGTPITTKYRGTTKRHPWVVVVERRTATVTWFRMVRGPAKTRTKLHKLLNSVFDRDFERISGKDPL